MNNSKYIDPVELKNNGDFYIPDEIIEALYKKNPPESYKIVEMKVGKIRRAVDGVITTLYDTINYRFLISPDDPQIKNSYIEYCNDIKNTHDNSSRSIGTFENVEKDISSADYDINKGVIIVNQYNFVQDGLHRSCVLLKKYGPNHKIKVLKIYKKTQRRMRILSPLFEIKEYAVTICKNIVMIFKRK